MRNQPSDVDPRPALRAWGIDAVSFEYLPVGFGDHHWTAADDRGRQWFVTVADLAHKNHNGIGATAAREGLRRAMDTAAALRHLDFVLAPVRTQDGETLRPIDDRYAVSVFPFLDGTSGRFGDPPEPVGDLLDRLHRTPPPPSTPVARPELPGRAALETALAELGHRWTGGPFAERARELLAGHRTVLRRRLAEFDRLVDGLRGEMVVTHGEPHPGNIMRVGERRALFETGRRAGSRPGERRCRRRSAGLLNCARRLLVDWDTVGVAVPERDLWWLGEGRPDPLALYRLRWDLDDLSVFVEEFRASHTSNPDTEQAWTGLAGCVERLTA